MNWIEISRDELENNLIKIKRVYGEEQKVGIMIKANAYGHGSMEIVRCIYHGVKSFYVTDPYEAFKINNFFKENQLDNNVICVGEVQNCEVIRLVEEEIEFAIIDYSYREWPKCSISRKPRVHLFIDTGLGREGIRWDDYQTIDEILSYPFEIVGIMTHFSNAEHEGPPEYAQMQLSRYNTVLRYLHNKGINPVRHTAASVPSMLYPEARLDITRVGIMLYGYWTSIESKMICKRLYGQDFPNVKPVLSWKAKTNNIKIIPKGDYVGYDCAYLCNKTTKIATINVGYFDGYPCLFNTLGWGLVNGVRCPIIGNVMMNSMVLDITDADVDDECIVVLIGKSGKEEITVDNLAEWMGITNYDILAALKPHITRYIV